MKFHIEYGTNKLNNILLTKTIVYLKTKFDMRSNEHINIYIRACISKDKV